MPSSEVCDAVDNDCDGAVDEKIEMECGLAVGACTMGIQTCVAGAWLECVGAIEPTEELCDAENLDENCDGQSNEGCTCSQGETMPCGPDKGICGTQRGVQVCSSDGVWAGCVGGQAPETERCDGVQDEDCDGLTDDQDSNCECIDGRTESCVGGRGVCAAGMRACADGKWSECEPMIASSAETCDGVDSDCDGTVDNGARCPNGQVCSDGECVCRDGATMECSVTSTRGPCVAGRSTCSGGKWGECRSITSPTAEKCDGVDTDCDGSPDNGAPCADGQVCSGGRCVCRDGDTMECSVSGARGPCQSGTRTCRSGAWGNCVGAVMPKTEVCDGMDNNCDGAVDECSNGYTCSMGNCLPGGSYLASCSGCRMDGGSLRCDACKDGRNGTHATSLSPVCNAVTNCSGQLSCIDCFEQIKQQGSFDESCENCTYNGKSITCDCKDREGVLQHTEFYDLPCPGGINNTNGKLTC